MLLTLIKMIKETIRDFYLLHEHLNSLDSVRKQENSV